MRGGLRGLVLLLAGCGGSEPVCDCSAWGVERGCVLSVEPRARGSAPDELDEASGLALSGLQTDRLWSHNDAGGAAELYALSSEGRLTGVYTVQDALAVDWEAMAVGIDPGSGRSTLYVADIGDNEGVREEVRLRRLVEPEPGADEGLVIYQTLPSEAVLLRYPEGPQDAETLLRDPREDALWILPREPDSGGEIGLYRLPATASGEQLLSREGGLSAGGVEITGGEIHPAGDWVALHTDDERALLWALAPGETLPLALARPACELQLPGSGGAGEALAAGSSSLWTVAEGVGAELWELPLP